MREKLMEHGADTFATYELLEIYLYKVARCKDTNPLSKSILKSLVDISGVYGRGRDDFIKIPGVGTRTADALLSLRDFFALMDGCSDESTIYESADDYSLAGEMFVEYFAQSDERQIAMMTLDNKGDVIDINTVYTGVDYESGVVKPQPFIDLAMKDRAAGVVLAHNHPDGAVYPSEGDRVTNGLIADTFRCVGIRVREHYVISGRRYLGFMNRTRVSEFSSWDDPSRYRSFSERHAYDSAELSRALAPVIEIAADRVALAIRRCGNLERLLAHDCDELTSLLGINLYDAMYIKVMAALYTRTVTEHFRPGGRYTDMQVADLLRARFLFSTCEKVYLLSLDAQGRFIACDPIGDGTVNLSSILPRKSMERAVKRGAKTIYLAHNHPGGYSNPSDEDMLSTESLYALYSSSGIRLAKHFVVSGKHCSMIDCETMTITKLDRM